MVQDVFKVLPNPEGVGSVLLDPEGMGPISLDPSGMDSISLDPEGAGPVLPDPLGVGSISPNPKGVGSISPDPTGVGFVLPDEDPYHLQPIWVKEYDPRVKLLTLGGKRARLDVTRGRNRPYLRAHIANSVGHADAVLPNPRTASDRSTC